MSQHEEILAAVFDCCPSERFDRHIGGPKPNRRIRATIPRPREVLAALRRRFSDQDLLAAGVAQRDGFSELRIAPGLCHPGGAVMALREGPTTPPFELLTGRGAITGKKHPVIAALGDGRRAALVDETGMLLAAHRIKDAAALDLLDLPAAPAFGLSAISFSACREIDGRFGEGMPRFAALDAQRDQETSERNDADDDADWRIPASDQSPAFRPMLVLVDQLGREPQDKRSKWLENTAGRFAQMRRHTGLRFAGVWIWQPDDRFSERLRFVSDLRDRAQIREVFLQSFTSLVDIETLAESPADQSAAGADYLTARRSLLQQLGAGVAELSADGGRLADAWQRYDSAVRLELAEPLICFAKDSANPAISVAGVQLAEVVTLLHGLAPRLHALQMHHYDESSGGLSASLDSDSVRIYLGLLDRFCHLSKEIVKWSTA